MPQELCLPFCSVGIRTGEVREVLSALAAWDVWIDIDNSKFPNHLHPHTEMAEWPRCEPPAYLGRSTARWTGTEKVGGGGGGGKSCEAQVHCQACALRSPSSLFAVARGEAHVIQVRLRAL